MCCFLGAANWRNRQSTFHIGMFPWPETDRSLTAKLAQAGFIRYGTQRVAQCVYCMEKVNFALGENVNRHPMLVRAEKNLECAIVVEKLTKDEGEALPLRTIAGEKQEEREQLWKIMRDHFKISDDRPCC